VCRAAVSPTDKNTATEDVWLWHSLALRVAGFDFPDFERPYEMVSLSHPDGYATNGGRQSFASLRSTGSHDFGLIAVLELADRLGRLPSQVVVWCIEGRRFEIGQSLSPELFRVLPEVKGAVAHPLSHA
jgi:hypothetical protein